MDKLKKRILLVLLLLLTAGLLGIGVLLRVLSQPKTHRPQHNDAPADYTQEISRPQPEENFAAQPYDDKDPDYEAELELTRLETEELKPFLPESSIGGIQKLNQNPLARSAAFMLGVNYFQQQYAKKEISEQELQTKMSAFKETLERQRQRRLERSAADVKPAVQEPPAPWQEEPCDKAILPADAPQDLTCRWGEAGFCAFFKNGRPYFCRTKNAQTRYRLNEWGSFITVTQKTPLGLPLLEIYYADGRPKRATEYDGENNLVTQIWFDGGDSFRLTQTDNTGRVLGKYYFIPGKPYVHYPDGNDMGEINGPWELRDGRILMDGQPFYTLPEIKPAPDVCQLFAGACGPAQTQGAPNVPAQNTK